MTDPAGFAERRRRMVVELGIREGAVREAMLTVPRHEFLPDRYGEEAYRDEPVPLGPSGATISAPHMVVLLAEAAALRPGHRVLELGTGMGYLAAVVAEVVGPGGHVDTVEVDGMLASEARHRLARYGLNGRVDVHRADAAAGWPAGAPFDAVIVSFAVPELYPLWKEQLVEGGRLVAPVGDRFEQRLTTYERAGPSGRISFGPRCRFVPMRPGTPAPI